MAIADPRPLLDFPFVEAEFGLSRVDYVAQLNGQPASGASQMQAMEASEPWWWADFHTRPLYQSERRQMRAWERSFKGVMRTFLAYDPDAQYPITYPLGFAGMTRFGGGAFDGTATITGVSAGAISLSTLPPSFVVKAGDRLHILQSGRYMYLEVVEDKTGTSGGVLATLLVEPPILTTLFTTAGVANFAQPLCRMIIQPGSFSCVSRGEPTPATWRGIQKIF